MNIGDNETLLSPQNARVQYKIFVAGWYFREYRSFYDSVMPIQENVVVASHRNIPRYIRSRFKSKEYPNVGGSFGLYEQIRLDTDFSEIDDLDFVIFMHDDVTVLRLDFPQALFGVLETKKCAGNSIELPRYHGFDSIKECEPYARGDWIERARQIPDFKWQVVDGRCFAIQPETLQEVNGFVDVYWGTVPRLTNISLRLFSAKLALYYGSECVGYLSDRWLASDYLIEDKGDNRNRRRPPLSRLAAVTRRLLARVG